MNKKTQKRAKQEYPPVPFPPAMNSVAAVESPLLHPTALLNRPSMIMRNGNPYGVDSRGRSTFMDLNKMTNHQLALRLGQFPPPRIPSSFPGPRLVPGGIQPSLSMLCDVAVGDHIGKRGAKDDLKKSDTKRFKADPASLSIKDSPVLLERLSALGGGFPMPKWGGGFKKTQASKSVELQKKLTPRIGAFPMPPIKEGSNRNKVPTLLSYKDLWRSTDHELRREIFSRKLQRGHVKILERRAAKGL